MKNKKILILVMLILCTLMVGCSSEKKAVKNTVENAFNQLISGDVSGINEFFTEKQFDEEKLSGYKIYRNFFTTMTYTVDDIKVDDNHAMAVININMKNIDLGDISLETVNEIKEKIHSSNANLSQDHIKEAINKSITEKIDNQKEMIDKTVELRLINSDGKWLIQTPLSEIFGL